MTKERMVGWTRPTEEVLNVRDASGASLSG